jgi:F-type H+-transporting ATPase subunit c
MDAESIKFIAIAVVMFGAAIGPALSIGKIGTAGLDAIGRNPEASSKIQSAMILSIAFVEAIAIYGLVVALILKFVA